GAAVEGDHILGFRMRWNRGEVGDASDVHHDAVQAAVLEKKIVHEGDQRGAGSAGGDVALAEVGDGADPGAVGDDGRLADLERAGNAASEIFDGRAFVKNGLAVHADEVDRIAGDALGAAGFEDRFGVELT